ncbi:MAG: hypothetical protein RL518_965 [Pseudomonadota bacterium]
MEPTSPHNSPEEPTRFEGMRLPVSQLGLRGISTVLFLLERDSLENSLTNILSMAALCRAIEIERGCPPSLKVMSETQLWNSLQGFGENAFFKDILRGEHALFVTAASLYRRQMAQVVGTFALAGATLDAFPHLVDDSLPIGHRSDPRTPIRTLVSTVTREVSDAHVSELLRLAAVSEVPETTDPVVLKVRAALRTLQTTSFPWSRNNPNERREVIPSVHAMISEWRDGVTVPSLCRSYSEQHEEAEGIARSLWSAAEVLAPGVFQLIQFPFDETDEVVRERLRHLYLEDSRARYVVERGRDAPATSLSYREAIAFERRLEAGEPADELLQEIESILHDRKDRSCEVDLNLAELRGRDPRDTLTTILTRAQYLPDPNGVQYTILKSSDRDLMHTLEQHQIPLITHNSLWLVDVKEGRARPTSFSFQGQYLSRFLSMIEYDP